MDELLKQIADLTAENHKLKQCGNCANWNQYQDKCELDESGITFWYSFNSCALWDWQGVGE